MNVTEQAPSAEHRGFTLIECLIVLLIVAIVSAIAVLTLHPNNRQRLNRQSVSQLISAMQQAQTAAILGQSIKLLMVNDKGYRLSTISAFNRPHSGPLMTFPQRFTLSATPATLLNGIHFYGNGTSDAGQLLLRQGQHRYAIRIESNGNIHLETRNGP